MDYVPKSLINCLKMIGFDERESKTLTKKLQIKSISGTVKICKTFLSFSDPLSPETLKVCNYLIVLGLASTPEFV